MRRAILFLILILFLPSYSAANGAYSYDSTDTVVGMNKPYEIKKDESLIELARDEGIGYNEIADANKSIDPWVPKEGAIVTIPKQWVLPDTINEGIIVNLAEYRLYYFMDIKGKRLVQTFPLGIGREGRETPEGEYRIIEKIKDPTWHPPQSLKDERPDLPDSIPPGPKNPLGAYAMRLSIPTYLMHGTNRPYGVGRRVSSGCIRLYPEDIKTLFGMVKLNTKVKIIYKPIKIGIKDNNVYVEVHKDYFEKIPDMYEEAVNILKSRGLFDVVDTVVLRKAVSDETGVPVNINKTVTVDMADTREKMHPNGSDGDKEGTAKDAAPHI